VTPGDLLAVASTRGEVSERGVRTNIRIVVRYLGEWLAGTALVAIEDHLEDTAMAEVCRAQLWQWLHHEVTLSNGCVLDRDLMGRLLDEESANLHDELGEVGWSAGRYDDARTLLDELLFGAEYPEYLTIPAYELL
jgi:malate synthase